MSRALSFACASFPILIACVDPEGKFNDFGRRVAASRGDAAAPPVGDGGPCTVTPGSIEGDYLLALSISLAPTKPIISLTHISTPASDGGTGIVLDSQPLSAADRKTPVGDPVNAGPFPIDDTGTFTASLPGLAVTGEANPITNGDIKADITLTGNLCGDGSFFCGDLSGNVTAPLALDLAGSTFTLTKVDDPNALPTQPPINCAKDPSDPL